MHVTGLDATADEIGAADPSLLDYHFADAKLHSAVNAGAYMIHRSSCWTRHAVQLLA